MGKKWRGSGKGWQQKKIRRLIVTIVVDVFLFWKVKKRLKEFIGDGFYLLAPNAAVRIIIRLFGLGMKNTIKYLPFVIDEGRCQSTWIRKSKEKEQMFSALFLLFMLISLNSLTEFATLYIYYPYKSVN